MGLSFPIFGMTKLSFLKCLSPEKFHDSVVFAEEAPDALGVIPGFPMVTQNSGHCRLSLG